MFVYGIRCAPLDISVGLPDTAHADYYLDYSLLVFPTYTRTSCFNSHGHLTDRFWKQVAPVIERNVSVREVDLESPYITEGEDAVIKALQDRYPSLKPAWYYVPLTNVQTDVE